MGTSPGKQARSQPLREQNGVQDDVIVRTEDLTKYFGTFLAVDHIALEVHRGDIYGLLGPNGSGKTTTIRMLLGLVYPSEGQIQLFSREMVRTRARRLSLQEVGALVEQPTFYPFLSGRENLRGIAAFAGLPDSLDCEERIDEVLSRVALDDDADLSYRKYSLGMRQRLGLAAALLNRPQLMIVDEPMNGLDPVGVVEMRVLLKQLAKQGMTIMLSSHQLYEIQQICSRVAILKQGKLLVQGRVDDLLAEQHRLLFSFREPIQLQQAEQALLAFARQQSWLQDIEYAEPEAGSWLPPGGWLLSVAAPIERAADLNAYLASQGLYATEIHRREPSMEQYFLELTGGEQQLREERSLYSEGLPAATGASDPPSQPDQ